MEAPPATVTATYRPDRRVLSRKILALGIVGFAVFTGSVLMKLHHRDAMYLHDILPVHLLIACFTGLYLVYLNYTLFRSLAADYHVIRDAHGLEIHGEGKVTRLVWDDIRQIRFGDLYLKIDAYEGRFEIPFMPRNVQREIYRCHQKAAGMRPDRGHFLERHVRPEIATVHGHRRKA